MQKITLLTLENKSGSEELNIKITPLFEHLGVLDKAFEVVGKYQPMLIDLANELLNVIKDEAEHYYDDEDKEE